MPSRRAEDDRSSDDNNGPSRRSSISNFGLDELDLNGNSSNASLSKVTKLHRIIVGIDFGTTYTGVSWVETAGSHMKTLEDVHCIREWPGPARDADAAWKTPSRIAYATENANGKDSWGFEVLPKMKGYTWMKLLLDPEQATKYDDPSLKASEGYGVLRRPPNKSAVDLCGDYLGHVAAFAYKALEQRLSPEVLGVSPLEFWFTVPAVWSDRAKADTLRAAEKAARNAAVFRDASVSTFLIAEPEAAAVATISAITEGGTRHQIKPDDSILVCDCGGGTVDVTTYQITAFEPKLEFREILVGTGGKCGSTYIDRLFIEFMEKRFGTAYTDLSWEKKGPASRFMREFEGHKRDFGKSTDSAKYYEMMLVMDAPDSKYYDKSESLVKLFEDDLKSLFDPVVSKIVALIASQLDAERRQLGTNTIKTVILVGGFGDSRYLNDVVRKWCNGRGGIRVICPEYPQAAIVRGAALSGLHNLQPSSRRARRHYGFSISPRFDQRRHRPEYRYTCPWDNLEYARGYITWSLEKGDVVTEKTKISHAVSRIMIRDLPDHMKFDTVVYCCDMDVAPLHTDDPGVRKLATIEEDLTGFELDHFETMEKYEYKLCKVEMELQVRFGSRRGILCFRSLINGKEAGSTSVSFDGENKTDDLAKIHTSDVESATSCCIQ